MRLNLGCGDDLWGEVRVDIEYKTQTGIKSKLNVRADIHNLPFRNESFSETRCWHVLEHVTNPHVALREIRRVSLTGDIRFPVDDGYKRETLVCLLTLNYNGLLHAAKTRTSRAHLWVIHPTTLGLTGQIGSREFFPLLLRSGRKARLFRWIKGPQIRYEWRCTIRARPEQRCSQIPQR